MQFNIAACCSLYIDTHVSKNGSMGPEPTTFTSYDFMYMYTYIHTYIQTQACLSIYIHTNTHAYPHACLDISMHSYRHTYWYMCDTDSNICLPTNIHTHIHDFSISIVLEFPYLCKSGLVEIWKFQKYRNMEN